MADAIYGDTSPNLRRAVSFSNSAMRGIKPFAACFITALLFSLIANFCYFDENERNTTSKEKNEIDHIIVQDQIVVQAEKMLLLSTRTGVSTSKITPPAGRMFECGYGFPNLRKLLFPEYNQTIRYGFGVKDSQPNDLLFFGFHGPCGGQGPKRISTKYVQEHFQGKCLFVNHEPIGNIFQDKPNDHLRQLHMLPTTDQSVRSYGVASYLMDFFAPTEWNKIFDPAQKPLSTNKFPNGVIYLQSKCVKYREKAVAKLSTIGLHIHHGHCAGGWGGNRRNFYPLPKTLRSDFTSNFNLYREFRYCAVMDNTIKAGYISEKILLAFMGGCIPIYIGTEEIFDIFNPKAFVFYNTKHPQYALEQIREHYRNPKAYEAMISQPILAHGNQTVEDYFSFSDNVGGGKLKREIRAMMGLTP
jgi:hypothetical protein